MEYLPVHEAIPGLKAALADGASAVLVAPPGAGKTTIVPLELMNEPWAAGGKLIVLEPRRLAARAAAARMATLLSENIGETVGYRVRLDSRVSARTRVEVVTEGVFTRMILDDPGLDGVAGVIFDEFHERSLDGDLGLALALEARAILRDDLRILVMSATIDGAAVATLLGKAPVVESRGRMFPVQTKYVGRDAAERIEDAAVRAARRALAEESGSVLVFLPGQGEIRRTAERLAERVTDASVIIAPLFGALTPAEQDLAIAPAPIGKRKVVLATSIAQTSLTIEGVNVVVDCGLSRVPRYEPASGLTRLETVRVSRAAADQRRGRAGRLGPGVCYRLWDEPETRALRPFDAPEMADADLSGLALDLARWGRKDAVGLCFLDPPPRAAFAEARKLLLRLDALDSTGDLTAHGRALSGLPLPPRLAHMVIRAGENGAATLGARIAAILSERGLGGADTDLRTRLERLSMDRSARARDAIALASRWATSAARYARTDRGTPADPGLLLALAYPERVARARGKPGEYLLNSGRGVFVDPADPLAREKWLAVGELGAGAARDRILLAAALDEAALLNAFAHDIKSEERIATDPRGKVRAVVLRRFGEIVIDERPLDSVTPELIAEALIAQVCRDGLSSLPLGERSGAVRARVLFARTLDPTWPDFSDEALIQTLQYWLGPVLPGRSALAQLDDATLADALMQQIPWDRRRRLDAEAPERFKAPTGTRLKIDYAAEGGPRVEVRVQELFGLREHPAVGAGRAPLTLALLSPAHRPVQVTRDLPGFWRGSWAAVRTEMKGRYPRHHWPDDPASAAPTTRAKPRGT